MSSPSSPESSPRTADQLRDLLSGAPSARPALLDVRAAAEFEAGHVVGSGHLPAPELEIRRAELPPRGAAVLVLAGDGPSAHAAAGHLEAMGYAGTSWLAASLDGLGDLASDRGPAARLWRPAPFLAEIVAEIPRGPALDLAAGSGREATFLATQGFDVEAWDAAPEALERAADLARRTGVAVRTVVADLEARSTRLPAGHYALLVCFRFLHRPLFPAIFDAIAPQGHLVYETFRVGQERFGRPRRAQYLLRDGELDRRVRERGLDVLRYEEREEAGGPVIARIWARKP